MTQFKRFEQLSPVLPKDTTLIVNPGKGILSLLSKGDLIEQQVVSPLEMSLIVALLEAYPEHCSNAVLLSIVSHESVETCREKIKHALEERTMRALTKHVREMIVRCRKKLRLLDIGVVTMYERGCRLEPLNHDDSTTDERLLALTSES